jgi:hypothetical protein
VTYHSEEKHSFGESLPMAFSQTKEPENLDMGQVTVKSAQQESKLLALCFTNVYLLYRHGTK